MGIYAKVIADSISPAGIRLVTMEVCLHRMVLAELNTHRVFSRNYRSSRAVPVAKLLEEVRTNPAMPVFWGKNQAGMTAQEELSGNNLVRAKKEWRRAADYAVMSATDLASSGLHKQIANRVLEPFMYTYGIVTSTEWDNFFGLRLDKAAQPEMRALAVAMWQAFNESTPRLLQSGQWHLPYCEGLEGTLGPLHNGDGAIDNIIKMSVARCARVSIKPFDADRPSTLEEDLALYDKLVGAQPIHASPAEHQATPDELMSHALHHRGQTEWNHPEHHGNFRGWCQYRKMLPGEAVAPLPEAYR